MLKSAPISLANLHLGAFHIDGVQDLPESAVSGTEQQGGHLICGHFELIKEVRGSDSAWGYKRLQLTCAYQIACIAGRLRLLSLNLCPDGTIVRLTSSGLTDFRIDNVYTLADVSERALKAIQLNQIGNFIEEEDFTRYLHNKKELLLNYLALKEAS